MMHKNHTGNILFSIGAIMILLSVIAGMLLLSKEGILIGVAVALYGSFNGILAIGISEVINLLQDIKDK